MYLVLFICALLSGLGKAVRDNVAFRFNRSIFNRIRHEPTRKWFESNWKNKPDHPVAPLWDAWHAGDFLSYAAWAIMLGYLTNIIVAVLALSAMLTLFTLLYHHALMANSEDQDLDNKLFQIKRFWNYILHKLGIKKYK